jgi:hypothetical protein
MLIDKKSDYKELLEEAENELFFPKYFWKGMMNCYVKVEKKKLFRNSEKTYWFVIGSKGSIYLFKESNSRHPKNIYNINYIKYTTIKPDEIEIIYLDKKIIIKFLDIENKKKFDELYLNFKIKHIIK